MEDEERKEVPSFIFSALERSGFPFQTAIHLTVNGTRGWVVIETEYPWRDWSGRDEFLDLIINHENLFATIECKKTEKESYIFLLPLGVSFTGQTERVRCLRGPQNFRLHSEDWGFAPGSPECEFCVVTTTESGKEQRLLERDASLLVRGTNAFAFSQEKILEQKAGLRAERVEDRMYFSIIVTNAPLYTARYEPPDISLQSGQFGKQPKDVMRVPWVRFRKAFTSPVGYAPDDRTVFVVQAEHLQEFLGSFEKGLTDNDKERNSLMMRPRGYLKQ